MNLKDMVSCKEKIISLLLYLMVCVLGLTACGLKGPPVPPGKSLPSMPLSFEARPETNGFVLAWEVEGEKPAGFRIYRASFGEGACTDCPLSFTLLAVLGSEARTYRDRIDPLRSLVYEIRPFIKGGAEGPPARVTTWDAGEGVH
ncbi:hypothetical protein OOT00_07180 [Desulfobotulus sp. H1]|uniref:Fibronectin type III domain-containing protein n=1 Tax=Desulfobotulus pelophilus TaxID=2823377 RepID=A0ABT3N8I2_9BACT|nr:hypothetical protein [Desulfobotulus pelophilus]MCW7753762.1 hypothetical protein [Desulfobotulus pelophilus]